MYTKFDKILETQGGITQIDHNLIKNTHNSCRNGNLDMQSALILNSI